MTSTLPTTLKCEDRGPEGRAKHDQCKEALLSAGSILRAAGRSVFVRISEAGKALLAKFQPARGGIDP